MPYSKFLLIFLLIFINQNLHFLELNTEVEQYLNEHIVKSFTNQSTLLTRMSNKNTKIKRKMSVKGAIKKTRSFMLDGDYIILNIFLIMIL